MPSPKDFPTGVWNAFERRQRTLHMLDAEHESLLVPDCDAHGHDFHRGEITIQVRVDGRSVIVRAHTWPDRRVWIDARHSARGGWRWQYTAHGRFVNSRGPRALVGGIERMLRTAQRPAAEVPDAMQAIWEGQLALVAQPK